MLVREHLERVDIAPKKAVVIFQTDLPGNFQPDRLEQKTVGARGKVIDEIELTVNLILKN